MPTDAQSPLTCTRCGTGLGEHAVGEGLATCPDVVDASPDAAWRAVARASIPAQPLDPAERSVVAGVALVGAADALAELSTDLAENPDLPMPDELRPFGPLQLVAVAHWLCRRAGLYGVNVELQLADADNLGEL